jgi:hypothetical protein
VREADLRADGLDRHQANPRRPAVFGTDQTPVPQAVGSALEVDVGIDQN